MLKLGYDGEYSADIAFDASASDYLQINPGIVVHSDTNVTLRGGEGTGIVTAGGEPTVPVTWGKPRIAEAMARVGRP